MPAQQQHDSLQHDSMNQKHILTAIKRRDTQKVLQLIHLPGCDINYATQRKITPLILASKLGLYSVAEKLIGLGVDLKATDIEGRTALHHASYHGKIDIIKLLIDAGCNVHALNNDGDQPLHEAVAGRRAEAVDFLLQAGSDVNRPNHVTGSTPLDLAVFHKSSEIVALLLKNSANAHHTSRAKETALHFAVQIGSTDIIQQLLDAGANINAINNIGESALTIAIQERQIKIVKYLVKAGCKLYSGDYLSPLCLACRQNSQNLIGYLLSEGYNVSADHSVRRYIYLQLEESSPDLLAYIYYRCDNPLMLKEICRVALRRHLNQSIKEKVFRLVIPKILQEWVAQDNIYEHMMGDPCLTKATGRRHKLIV